MFPKLNVEKFTNDDIKSPEEKIKWREYCEEYKENRSVGDYNYGTILRLDATQDYSQENSTIVPRIQFYAIEVARNREGYNKKIRKQK